MSRFMDGLLTVILWICVVPAVLALLAVMAVWWAVAIVVFFAVVLAGLIWPERVRRLLARGDDSHG